MWIDMWLIEYGFCEELFTPFENGGESEIDLPINEGNFEGKFSIALTFASTFALKGMFAMNVNESVREIEKTWKVVFNICSDQAKANTKAKIALM